ncbi:MAG TPA: LuxR C-terminal-related transcriptional regulator [Gaiellaceae bacterium]
MAEGAMTMQDDAAIGAVAAPSHIIKRPRLTKILDETEARIILLCAPAGYGKTTLAREWIATRSEPVLWYSGGPAMADVAALAVDLAELFADATSTIVDRIRFQVGQETKPAALAALLATAAPPSGAVLAIDDYQFASKAPAVEDFLAELARRTSFRWLITTRTTPAWLKARHIVYGEAISLGVGALAFTEEEASAVLPEGLDVLAEARGWPAVIGLAALTGSPDQVTPADTTALYEFFAGELFGAADTELQHALFALALGADADALITKTALGDRAQPLIEAATHQGFISNTGAGGVALHPLLRSFLLDRLKGRTNDALTLVKRVVEVLWAHEHWDECLACLLEFPIPSVVVPVLEAAVPTLLDNGRVATVQEWVALAESCGAAEAAPVWLARAELALREGRGQIAKRLAEHAAAAAEEPSLAARAHLVAARGAHLTEDTSAVLANAQRAEQLSGDHRVRMLAVWLALVQAYEQQDERSNELLGRVRRLADDTAEDQVRLACATAYFVLETESAESARDGIAELATLAKQVRDPMLATNYLYMSAFLNIVTGEYETALALSEDAKSVADSYGIAFAASYARLNGANACIGMRQLREARGYLRTLKKGDQSDHVLGNAAIAECRLAIAAGDLERALIVLEQDPPAGTSRALKGEHLANRALVLAAVGDRLRALEAIRDAGQISRYHDAVFLGALANAILGVDARESSVVATNAVSDALGRGLVNLVVTACRAAPQLAKHAASEPQLSRKLTSAFLKSRDIDLGRNAGLTMPREHRRTAGLSRRECEVIELVVQGRTNREIAKTLFISESTTKVHIRHIFEKLGVHSRAEAVAAVGGVAKPD